MNVLTRHLGSYALTAIGAIALGVGAASTAHAQEAGGKAFSSLLISDFQMFNDSTGDQIDVADFDSLDAGDAVTSAANLDGVSDSNSASRDLNPPTITSLGIADPAMSCVGPDCGSIGSNDYTQQDLSGDGSLGHFARADTFLEGSIISGTPDANSATADQVSETQLNQTGIAETNSRVTNSSEFSFILGEDTALRFDFNADAQLELALGQDLFRVDAGRSFNIAIADDDGGEVFNWSPSLGVIGGTQNSAGFNLNTQINRLSTGTTGPLTNSGFFSASTDLLTGGQTYNLTINGTTFADARVQVPEPGTLALLGAGLFGMGTMLYRRRRPFEY